jgi:hypothetical protein
MDPSQKANRLAAILITGLLVGTLDITAAIIHFIIPTYRNPILIFQYIASGMISREAAFAGGLGTAALGLAAHYFIATCWTALYYFAYPTVSRAIPNKVWAGLSYGVVVWLVMNLVVLPSFLITAYPLKLTTSSIIGVLILMVAVGLPVSFRATRFYSISK